MGFHLVKAPSGPSRIACCSPAIPPFLSAEEPLRLGSGVQNIMGVTPQSSFSPIGQWATAVNLPLALALYKVFPRNAAFLLWRPLGWGWPFQMFLLVKPHLCATFLLRSPNGAGTYRKHINMHIYIIYLINCQRFSINIH